MTDLSFDEHTALVVGDVQIDVVEPAGRLYVPGGEARGAGAVLV